MITREMIINELTKRGIEVQPADVIKNGVSLQGITIGTGNIRPTIYIDQFADYEEEKLEEVINKILCQYNEATQTMPEIDTDNLMNWDYVKTRLQLCIQRKGNEDIVKQDFLDLEKYVRVNVGNNGSFKVKPVHLERFGITEDALFHAAWDCTAPTIVIEDMAQIMAEMMGCSVEEARESMGNTPAMIVVSNKNKVHGAIGICATEKLMKIADKYERDLAILPSSIHEILLVPIYENTNFETLNRMVQEVNATQVAPEEVLSNHVYRLNREERSITFYHDTKSGKYTF